MTTIETATKAKAATGAIGAIATGTIGTTGAIGADGANRQFDRNAMTENVETRARRYRTIGSDSIGFDTFDPEELEFPVPTRQAAAPSDVAESPVDGLVLEQFALDGAADTRLTEPTAEPTSETATRPPHAPRVVELADGSASPLSAVGLSPAPVGRSAPAWAAEWATLEAAVELDDWVTLEDVVRGPSPSAAPVVMALAFLALLAVLI